MVSSIFDYPPVERKYVAVRRYRQSVGGENIFNRLLARLGLSYYEFVDEWGETLVGNPSPDELTHELAVMISEDARRIRNVNK